MAEPRLPDVTALRAVVMVAASTSVDVRGTVHLIAVGTDGTVTLGKGSTTAILLEDTDATALDAFAEDLREIRKMGARVLYQAVRFDGTLPKEIGRASCRERVSSPV